MATLVFCVFPSCGSSKKKYFSLGLMSVCVPFRPATFKSTHIPLVLYLRPPSGRGSRGSHAAGGVGAQVRPHSACDSKTVMESLVHFLQDVVTAGAEVKLYKFGYSFMIHSFIHLCLYKFTNSFIQYSYLPFLLPVY